jgi:hypothetical protein
VPPPGRAQRAPLAGGPPLLQHAPAPMLSARVLRCTAARGRPGPSHRCAWRQPCSSSPPL